MNVRLSSLVLGLLLLLVCAVPAMAAPVTVNLRVEGKTATHYEAPVTVDVRTVDGNDGSGAHTCDTTLSGGTSSPTAGGALATASAATPFAWKGTWFASFNDFNVDTIDGETPDFSVDSDVLGLLGQRRVRERGRVQHEGPGRRSHPAGASRRGARRRSR